MRPPWRPGARFGAAEAPAGATAPKVVSQQGPEYPWSLRLEGKKGEVPLGFVVDKEGNVTRVTVLKSSHRDFEAPAVEAVLQWNFKPGMLKGGRPVDVFVRVPMVHKGENPPEAGL